MSRQAIGPHLNDLMVNASVSLVIGNGDSEVQSCYSTVAASNLFTAKDRCGSNPEVSLIFPGIADAAQAQLPRTIEWCRLGDSNT